MCVYGRIDAWDHTGQKIHVPNVFVKGTGNYFQIKAYAGSVWVSLEMQPQCHHVITGLPAKSMRNNLYDLSEYIGKIDTEDLYSQLKDIRDPNEIACRIDSICGKHYDKWFTPRPVQQVLHYVLENKGLLNLSDLLYKFPYSERTLDRMFAREVGVSPHGFITLVRFNYMIREVEDGQFNTLSELIDKYNYYDHSHFEKDFKRFLGQSIKEYKNAFNPLLTNSLQRLYHADSTSDSIV